MTLAIDFPEAKGPPSGDAVSSARKNMFVAFCATLESHGIRYVILAGYRGYPDRIDSDVDFMVSEADFARLPALLNNPANVAGARLVQMLRHETSACYYVLARQVGEYLAYLHPDAAATYRRNGRLWLRSEAVLDTRRKSETGFWIPAAAVEFEYYFVKRIDKALVEARHLDALAALAAEDQAGCLAALQRLLPTHLQAAVMEAISRRDTAWFAEHRNKLKAALQQSLARETAGQRLRNLGNELLRKLRRILRPTGLVVAVLGPDGSGKTTIIEHLERELAPAFRRVRRFHLRPHFGAAPVGSAVTNPHGQSPRGRFASTLKVGMFLADYWFGWVKHVLPAKVRSSFIVFDRYYHDMLVDTKRYRIPGDFSAARWFAPLIPQPDLWLILSARPELLVERKGEISLGAAQQLTTAYQNLARKLPGAAVIDTSQPLDHTLAEAVGAVRRQLEAHAQETLKTLP